MIQSMHTKIPSIEEDHWDIVPVKSEEFQVSFGCDVNFLQFELAVEFAIQLHHQFITQRTRIFGVQCYNRFRRYHWVLPAKQKKEKHSFKINFNFIRLQKLQKYNNLKKYKCGSGLRL